MLFSFCMLHTFLCVLTLIIFPFHFVEGKLNFSALKARREAARAGGGSKGEWEASCRERKPIGKGKKKTDRDLPPPLPNRSANAGRDCQGGRASRLDEGFPPTGDRRMSPRAGGKSRAEQTVIALNCGLKRPRDDLPPPTSRPSWSFSGSGVNRSEGVESFWDEEDGGLAWKKSRALLSSYDLSHLEESSDRVVAEAMAGGCIQVIFMLSYRLVLYFYVIVVVNYYFSFFTVVEYERPDGGPS